MFDEARCDSVVLPAFGKIRSSPRKRGPRLFWIPAFAGMKTESQRNPVAQESKTSAATGDAAMLSGGGEAR